MSSGFNVVDFMNLPAAERCLVRLVLRQVSVTYPDLRAKVEALSDAQRLTQPELDMALEHLTRNDWLILQRTGGETRYRVNAVQRNSQNGSLWDGIDLDAIDSASPYDVDLHAEDDIRPMKRGGKRLLPYRIWDCLAEPPAPATEPSSTARSPRRASPFDLLFDMDDQRNDD